MKYIQTTTIKFLTLIGTIWFLFSACDDFGNGFLEKEPSVDVTQDTIFNSLELSERYLWGGYSTLPYGLNTNWSDKGNKLGMDILESMSDLCQSYLNWGGMNSLYYTGQYSAAVENNSSNTKYHFSKEQSWEGIRIGWKFIENADRIPNTDPKYIEQLKAEAKMIIAIHYVDMFRHFGGLPWVDHAYEPVENTDLPRTTAKATMNSIVDLIDEAIPDLPWVVDDLSNWDGRFTQAAAMGLKARLLLFGASPLFNDSEPYLGGEAANMEMTWFGGYDPSLWNRTAEAAKMLLDKINSQGGYSLVNSGNPRQDFQDSYYARGNSELLISTRVRFRSPAWWSAEYYFYQSAGNYGTGCPTKEYVDMFDMADGTPIDDPNSGWDPNDPWANRDPRLYETVLVNGDSYRGRSAELYIGGRERNNLNFNGSRSGFGLRKFLLERQSNATGSIVQWPYLRLSEIYLTYAEALNEANGGPTMEAYSAVNMVRERVGLKGLPLGLSQQEFREAVLKERACEFGYEEVRWFDLVRWKRENDFRKVLHGVNTRRAGNGSLNYEVFELPARYWRDNWSPKWYLSAFPPDEINKNYGLVQNPGWE